MQFRLHERLVLDTYELGRFEQSHVLLHRNAAWGWLILVPHTEQTDLFQLPEAETSRIMQQARRLTLFLREQLQFPKINFAAIGNVVPQLHLHVIGRRPGDVGWPAPVWGLTDVVEAYSRETVEQWRKNLIDHYGLQPPSDG